MKGLPKSCSCYELSATEILEHCKHSSMIFGSGAKVQLDENARHVALYRRHAYEQPVRDSLIGQSLGHEG
jgi:hypothetical protein